MEIFKCPICGSDLRLLSASLQSSVLNDTLSESVGSPVATFETECVKCKLDATYVVRGNNARHYFEASKQHNMRLQGL